MPKLTLHFDTSVTVKPSYKQWLELATTVAAKMLPSEISHAAVNVLICGDARIKKLNGEHRSKPKVTDVLSFPAHESIRSTKEDWSQWELVPVGDIVICLAQARRQAAQFGIRTEEEIVHLFFHGFLHLLGYDHEVSLKEEKIMQTKETDLLKSFALKRSKTRLK